MIKLDHEISLLKGVGPALKAKLNNQGIKVIEDFLFVLPLRYEDRTNLYEIKNAPINERCLIQGKVNESKVLFYGRRALQVIIDDGSALLKLRFFHFSNAQFKQFKKDANVVCFGLLKANRNQLEMIHPEYRILSPNQEYNTEETLTPIYSIIDGIGQGRLRNLILQAIAILRLSKPKELIPQDILKELALPALTESLIKLHNPPKNIDYENISDQLMPYKLRLSFEELLANYMSLKKLRILAQNTTSSPLEKGEKQIKNFINTLEFELTSAQNRVSKEILKDLSMPQPMMRMLQGDVGSGKTIVSAIACLKTILNKKQVALMAPTELLAEQHMESFSLWFKNTKIKTIKLTGSLKQPERLKLLAQIETGEADLIIGTHALFQEGVNFKTLALIIIDEQHRFGVNQRVALREKGSSTSDQPHQLIMTATPIPRTLAMAAYADLDSSIIDELPGGRKPVKTLVIPNNKRNSVIERIKIACLKGQQTYWVCPLIDESENIEADAATKRFKYLQNAIKPIKIGLVHGRQKSAVKENTMRLFKNAKIDLLVATTVIEVGVDAPNANLMVIENAERMGLSQLHQLRGRVGRGNAESHCILLYKSPLNSIAHKRLSILRNSNDGFFIAQKDLELRGPGEILGKKQKGLPQYKIANLTRDGHLMPSVQKTASKIMEKFPRNTNEIILRWLGNSNRLGKV